MLIYDGEDQSDSLKLSRVPKSNTHYTADLFNTTYITIDYLK